MVIDGDVDVVKEVESGGLPVMLRYNTGVLGCSRRRYVTSHRKAGGAKLVGALGVVAPRDWHVVDDPVLFVAKHHAVFQELDLVVCRLVVFLADFDAFFALLEVDVVRRWTNSLELLFNIFYTVW